MEILKTHLVEEINRNTTLQIELLNQIKQVKLELRKKPESKILLFKLSLLYHQFDLYNEKIKTLEKELNM